MCTADIGQMHDCLLQFQDTRHCARACNVGLHEDIAATMARFVAGRLLKGLCLWHERGGDAASREHRSHQRHHETPAAASSEEWETCWERADILPVAGGLNGSWALIDEGKVKGVPKLGLASWSVGESIDLGPLPGPDAPLETRWRALLDVLPLSHLPICVLAN